MLSPMGQQHTQAPSETTRWGGGRANVGKEREEDGEKEGGRMGEAFHPKLFPLFIFSQIL